MCGNTSSMLTHIRQHHPKRVNQSTTSPCVVFKKPLEIKEDQAKDIYEDTDTHWKISGGDQTSVSRLQIIRGCKNKQQNLKINS